MAGIIAGKTFGVAKKSKIISVKVLDINGMGSWENVISGIQWVVKNSSGKKNIIIK